MVGLTGYPNVGKSSTINALFGSKKTAVAATPGKTKHFQTLNITDRMTLCDCPGLVLPKFAASKAEMVAAGACTVLLIGICPLCRLLPASHAHLMMGPWPSMHGIVTSEAEHPVYAQRWCAFRGASRSTDSQMCAPQWPSLRSGYPGSGWRRPTA